MKSERAQSYSNARAQSQTRYESESESESEFEYESNSQSESETEFRTQRSKRANANPKFDEAIRQLQEEISRSKGRKKKSLINMLNLLMNQSKHSNGSNEEMIDFDEFMKAHRNEKKNSRRERYKAKRASKSAQFSASDYDNFRKAKMEAPLLDLTKPHTWYPLARTVRRKIFAHVGPTNSGKVNFAIFTKIACSIADCCADAQRVSSVERSENRNVLLAVAIVGFGDLREAEQSFGLQFGHWTRAQDQPVCNACELHG
jgi:hypothetical protein